MGSNNEHRFKTNRHVVYSCKYHVVWYPKYRRKVLVNGTDERLIEIMPDHVDLHCEVDPQFGIHRRVRYLKGRSSHQLRKEYPWLRSRLSTFRTNSIFVAPVGGARLAVIEPYMRTRKAFEEYGLP
jgi:putative transposase